MWWQDLLWGIWNGLTAWIVLVAHVFGQWEGFPLYDAGRSGNWYDFGFLLGAGSPLLGALRRKRRVVKVERGRVSSEARQGPASDSGTM